jgi:D-xylose reductase
MTVQLKNGKMPLVGLGLWKMPKESAGEQVYQAIKAGYRLLDGASDYGNEKECAEGLNRAVKDGLVKREDIFVTSKLWGTFHAKPHVEPACRKSLADWGLDYFDLYLIHFPLPQVFEPLDGEYPPTFYWRNGTRRSSANVSYQEMYQAMEKLVEKGLAKNIGVSNVNVMMIMDVLRYAVHPPDVLQMEHHPYLQQTKLVKFCKEHQIAITAYSSFGMQSYVELGVQNENPLLMEHPVVVEIAKKHAKTPAHVLLRWAVQRNVAVIPKSSNPVRLAQNLDVLSWNLNDDDMTKIAALERGLRFNDPEHYYGIAIFG